MKKIFFFIVLCFIYLGSISCTGDLSDNEILRFEGLLVDSSNNPLLGFPVKLTYFNRNLENPEILPSVLSMDYFNPPINSTHTQADGSFFMYYPETRFPERKLIFASQNSRFQYMLGDSLVTRNYIIVPKQSIDYTYSVGTVKIIIP